MRLGSFLIRHLPLDAFEGHLTASRYQLPRLVTVVRSGSYWSQRYDDVVGESLIVPG
jgi:hypothetical protein